MKVIVNEPERSRLRCLHCGKTAYYPVGGIGCIDVPEREVKR